MWRTATCLVVLIACGGNDSGSGDEQPSADASAPGAVDAGASDATPSACQGPGDCPCFSNYDCPDTHVCTSTGDTGESVFCLLGSRGQGVAGEPCVGEESCASALCVEDDSGSFCSDLCEDADECPAVLPRCLYIGFGVDVSICAPQ